MAESETASLPSAIPKTTWDSLPPEIIRGILGFTDLLAGFQPVGCPQGLPIVEFSADLLRIDKRSSLLGKDILWSDNRIILKGHILGQIRWLAKRPREVLSKIRRLDLVVYFSSDHDADADSWIEITTFIHNHLNLQQLELTIDGCYYYDIMTEDVFEFNWLRERYQVITSAFKKESFRKLKQLFIFWPKYASLESKSEKEIMGKDYDSSQYGKIPYEDRDYRLPHGWEWAKEIESGELDQDWMEYEHAWMNDCERL